MKRRTFLNVTILAAAGAPLVAPAMLAAKPAPLPVAAWDEIRATFVSVRAALGSLTIIAGEPKSGKTHQLCKLHTMACAYDMPMIIFDPSCPIEASNMLEEMFGRGRHKPSVAYAMTWNVVTALDRTMISLLRHTKKLHYNCLEIPVILAELPSRTGPSHAV